MKQNKHRFLRAMLFIAVMFTSFLGVAASTPGLLTETDLPKTNTPSIYLGEGVGKYTVSTNSVVGSEVYCRINSGEWFHYKKPLVFDEYGSYQIEAYATSYDHSPSDIISKNFVVDEHTGESLVDPDADDPSIIFFGGFKYKINGSTVSLTRQTDAMCSGDLIIPPCIVHNGVTYPVTEVESWSCYSTNNITSVYIPSSVTEVGMYAFNSCPKLRSITVDPDNPNYSDVDGVLYNKEKTYLLSYPNARSTQYTIPDGVIMIYYSAFQEDFDLEEVTIPSSVISIRTSAFSSCHSLKSIVLPPNLSVFNWAVFSYCKDLKSVTFPTTINKIPEWTFEGCRSLETVVIPANIKTIAEWAFQDCYALSSVTLPEGLKSINANAFEGCRSLSEITIPKTVTTIGESAFYRCLNLVNFHVDPANTQYCDVDGVLYNKAKTTLLAYPLANPRLSYNILPTTQVIGKQAFDSSRSLEQISIPSGVTSIGDNAFMYCDNMKDMYSYIEDPASITISSMTFYQYPVDPERTLHVPMGTIEQYQAVTNWSKYFGSIVETSGISGDVDDDNNVNIGDVTYLIDLLLNGGATPPGADVDGDGKVTIADVTSLIDMLLTTPAEPVVLESGDIETITVNGVSFNMVYVASGTFEMGAPPEAYYNVDNCRPVHQVTLSDYYIGQTEVTQELWTAVMGSNPSYYVESNQQPVHMITWANCQSFITKLNQLTGKNFRLPTEAEWEYAARGADKTNGYDYAGGVQDDLDDICWNSHNTASDNYTWGAHPVAMKRPNEIGLYDMSGNVEEWLNDYYAAYTADAQVNPQGPATGTNRCLRGGCYSHNWWDLRVFQRHSGTPSDKHPFWGMRLALSK